MYKTILVAIDLEDREHNNQILAAAKNIADANGSDVYLLTVVAAAPAIVSQFLHENYEQLASGQAAKDLTDVAVKANLKLGEDACLIRFGVVYEEVLAAAEIVKADLIVTGSHKPDTFKYLLGSSAARIVRHSDCAVLVVR